MKRLHSLMVIALSVGLIFSQAVYAQNVSPNAKIFVNGKLVETDKNIQLANDCIYVPANDIFKALGYTVEYDSDFKLIRAKKAEDTIVIQTNGYLARVNGKMVQMKFKPLLVNGSAFVPLDFFKESMGPSVTLNTYDFNVNIYQKNAPVNTLAGDVSEDQKVADRIATNVNKTPAELMKLRTQEGSWQKVILNLVSEQKSVDKSMVIKFKPYFDNDENTIIKMKYKLGNWVDVFGYLITMKEDKSYYSCLYNMENYKQVYKGKNSKELNEALDKDHRMMINAVIDPLCGTHIIASEDTRWKWEEALKNVKNRIEFLDGAKYIGMPENVIKDLKDRKFLDYEIYIKARDTWVFGGSYTDPVTGAITDIKAHCEIKKTNGISIYEAGEIGYSYGITNKYYVPQIIKVNDVTSTDPVDYMVMKELKIPDAMVDKCKLLGISDIVSIAKLNIWGITDDDDIKEFKSLMEKYPVTIDELNKIRTEHVSWQQTAIFLHAKYK